MTRFARSTALDMYSRLKEVIKQEIILARLTRYFLCKDFEKFL